MASKNSGQLSPNQIVRLARVITVDNMESIAEGYLEIEEETIKNLYHENKGKAEAFNRSVLRYWKNKNPETNQNLVSSFRYLKDDFYRLPLG